MRIGLFVPGGVDPSGRERVIPALLWLIARLARRHDVHVFALRQTSTRQSYPLHGATVHDLAVDRGWLGALGSLATHVRAAGLFDVFHAFWADTPGLLARGLGRLLDVPAVVSLAGGELVALPEIGYGNLLTARGRLKTLLALRGASAVTAASHALCERAAAFGIEALTVPLGVPRELFRERDTRRPGPWRLLSVASLNRVKDHVTLLRALALLSREESCHLDLVGEDTLGGAVQAEAKALGLSEHVTFHGFLPADELPLLYGTADLLVVSSRHEAGPVVALEASAQEVPVVGTSVGHLRDGSPERFLAVPPGDPAALAGAIGELLRDPARRHAMARRAHDWAFAHDADATAVAFEDLYGRLRLRAVVGD